MRVATVGHAVFAALLIGIGVHGLTTGQFTTVWQPVPRGVPAREVLAYGCALLSLTAGIGLLWRPTAALAARVLLASLCLWLVMWRVRPLFLTSLLESSWSLADTMVMAAGAWVLFAWFATDWDYRHLGFAAGDRGARIARALYGLGLIPFGYAHFANASGTAALVPRWLPWHMGWAYFTGTTFIVAGAAILSGTWARLAAVLATLQIGLFALLVWLPVIARGSAAAFQWMEFTTTLALMAAGWVVAESYGMAADPAERLRPIRSAQAAR